MYSLLQNLQTQAMDSSSSVSELLRFAKVVATKVGDNEFLTWVDKELNGYGQDKVVPEYRMLEGEPKGWNPMYGWVPFIIDDPDTRKKLSRRGASQSIGELEDLVRRSTGSMKMDYPAEAQKQFSEAAGFNTKFVLMLDPSSIVGILDFARNKIFDWTIKQIPDEEQGKGGIFYEIEEEKAKATVYNIENIGQVGNMGDVRDQAQVNAINFGSDKLEEIKKVVDQIKQNIQQLDTGQRPQIEQDVKILDEELTKEQPESSKITKALRSIKGIAEQSTGNLVAQGIVMMVQKLLEQG